MQRQLQDSNPEHDEPKETEEGSLPVLTPTAGLEIGLVGHEFSIDGEDNNYALRLGDYDGTTGDSFDHHRGRPFSTFDNDNDAYKSICAKNYLGAY
ncbi:tenascin-r [Plakobranchus ocellatus]|uniref:Tenascin-r n=1 Tax=Plakobranchus ocellatus TaxID=259542 RepID=A0AAV4B2R1_9GAST|nr:tenascin-r [Plakobranchus ocellatus]